MPETDTFLMVNYAISKQSDQYQNLIRQNMNSTFASNLYVRGIPKGVSEEQLREKFSSFDVHIHIREGETKRTIIEKPKIVSLVLKEAKVYEGKEES